MGKSDKSRERETGHKKGDKHGSRTKPSTSSESRHPPATKEEGHSHSSGRGSTVRPPVEVHQPPPIRPAAGNAPVPNRDSAAEHYSEDRGRRHRSRGSRSQTTGRQSSSSHHSRRPPSSRSPASSHWAPGETDSYGGGSMVAHAGSTWPSGSEGSYPATDYHGRPLNDMGYAPPPTGDYPDNYPTARFMRDSEDPYHGHAGPSQQHWTGIGYVLQQVDSALPATQPPPPQQQPAAQPWPQPQQQSYPMAIIEE